MSDGGWRLVAFSVGFERCLGDGTGVAEAGNMVVEGIRAGLVNSSQGNNRSWLGDGHSYLSLNATMYPSE